MTIFDDNVWRQFLMTIFDDTFWWQFLMAIFDDNFWWKCLQFLLTRLPILTTFDKFDHFLQFWFFLTIFDILWQFWTIFNNFGQFLTILDNFDNWDNFWQLERQSWRLDIWDTDYNSDNWEPEFRQSFLPDN